MWRDRTEVKWRTADSKVPGSNPGGGTTKKNRSFHDLLQLGLKSSSRLELETVSQCAFLEFDLLQRVTSNMVYYIHMQTNVRPKIQCTRSTITQVMEVGRG